MTKLVISTSKGLLVKRRVRSFLLCDARDYDQALPKLLSIFMGWPDTKKAFMSAEDAEQHYPGLIKKLSRFLTDEGWDNAVFEVQGYKKRLAKNAADDVIQQFNNKKADGITHAVVCVRQLVLDPCRLRMGETYDLPWNYQVSRIDEYWKEKRDVTHLLRLTSEDVQALLRANKQSGGVTNKYMAMQ